MPSFKKQWDVTCDQLVKILCLQPADTPAYFAEYWANWAISLNFQLHLPMAFIKQIFKPLTNYL